MGIFSTKKKLRVFTAAERMIADEHIIDSSKAAIMRYIIENESNTSASLSSKSIPDYLIEASQSSILSKFNRAYNYAKSGSYAYGLPTANNLSVQGVDIEPVVQTYLETLLGHSVTMLYTELGDANYQHFMWHKLINNYGYNPTTNELTSLSTSIGFPCYLYTGKLIYGIATVNSDETGKSLKQLGVSTESGECLGRTQDLDRALVPIDVNTDVQDASVSITYKYIEIIPDTLPPPDAVVNNLTTTYIDGYAEKGSDVEIYLNTVLQDVVTTGSDGYFNYTFVSTVVASDVVQTKVIDLAFNESTGLDTVVPYTNGTPAIEGTEQTITEFERTGTLIFDLLDYIPSAIPVIPAEADDTPTIVIGDDTYVPEYEYIQAGYKYELLGVTHVAYLTYAYGTNTIPELEDLFASSESSGEFYPRLYARLDGNDLVNTLDPASSEYKTSTYLAKLLSLNWKDWSKTLHESIEDIADVKHLFITTAVPLNTSDIVLQEYLYRYWLKVHTELDTLSADAGLIPLNGKEGTTLEVKDSVYTHYVSFDAVSSHTVSGVIGAVGFYQSEYVNSYEAAINDGYVPDSGTIIYSPSTTISNYPAYHVYKFQNTPTTYREVRVYGAKSVHSFEGESSTSLGENDTLLIPLDRTAITYMTKKEQEILFAKSFYLFVVVAKVIKIKWYQRGAFRIVMTIIAVVIAVVTVGAGAPISAYIIAAVQAIAINIAINIAIKVLIKLGVSKNIAGILVFIAAVYGGGAGISAIANNTQMLLVTQLLQIASLAFQISAKVSAIGLKELQKEAEIFFSESSEKQAALQRARDLLDTQIIDMDLELLLSDNRSKVFITLGESPEEFLNKNVLNLTESSVSLVENYVDITMQPPSLAKILNQTKRGDDYVVI